MDTLHLMTRGLLIMERIAEYTQNILKNKNEALINYRKQEIGE